MSFDFPCDLLTGCCGTDVGFAAGLLSNYPGAVDLCRI